VKAGESKGGFENSLARLEEIVEKLASSDLGLDASTALFREGMELSRLCEEKLSEVERRVEIVRKESDGGYATAPFPGADEDEGRGEEEES
jgi:exodeoxyribonuclease VII small subunit